MPNQHILNAELNYFYSNNEETIVNIIDATGKTIFAEKLTNSNLDNSRHTIDFSKFSPGIYLIKFNSDNKQIIKRIIKS